jgi:hypothetical protein
LLPYATGEAVHADARLAIVVVVLGLGWLTKVLVEDPVRRGRLLTARSPRWTFTSALAATAVVAAVALGASSHLENAVQAAQQASERVLASKPRCFGAAARDPREPCANRRLARTVVPTPLAAADRPNAPCDLRPGPSLVHPCFFGVDRKRARDVVALIGDSHASHMRAALAVVARENRWHGISIARSGCPLTRAVKYLPTPAERSDCVRFGREVVRWLRRHREVSTVVVSQITGSSWVASGGRSEFETAVAGFASAWRALPRSVEHVVVIRDTPKADPGTAACVERAIARRAKAAGACSLPRAVVLERDPAAVAADRMRSERVDVVDFTRFICGGRRCYPVVGGALVYKDQHHLTTVFAATLGPYLQRQLRRRAGL